VQSWHVDGTHLFAKKLQCPPHCLDVFVPLMDMTPELGPTEFVLGSHTLAAAASLDKLLRGEDDGQESVPESARCAPVLRAGSAVLYDHRLVHRGTANTSSGPGVPRPMLYLMYSKPWFKETLNFGDEALFGGATGGGGTAAAAGVARSDTVILRGH
jgi:ectoine hydroxylase-related dioxygenase (phytanoyl-CoA dioxygenase family)